MTKLTSDLSSSMSANAIGEDGLLRFIDEMNERRARRSDRYRFEPVRQDNGILGMRERYALPRPARPDTPSPRYATTPTTSYGYKD